MHHSYLYFSVSPGAIKKKVELDWGTEDSEYLQKVELHSEGALNEVRPDIIVYNAGTDILDGDPLGGLSISPQVPYLLFHTLNVLIIQVVVINHASKSKSYKARCFFKYFLPL